MMALSLIESKAFKLELVDEGVTLEYRRFYLIYLDILFVLVLYLPPLLYNAVYDILAEDEFVRRIDPLSFFYYSSSYIPAAHDW